ncbi:MFS family permease [Kibdelosporangium banguiense]|uniref:MFS family permease n=1 Tax=Kibdelosporangium banguiense TaxID=1365924 RepID=A0ABS4TVM7_9PSEU|nr:MFS transporter [Kibdelosporangium banguiense]MBP2328442.1 MFS family permease [Kibdelosporangium banguiense]
MSSNTVPGKQKTRLGRTFHRLLAATAISTLGDGMYLAALPLLAVSVTDSPLVLGFVGAAGEIPWLLFGLHAGALVDRWDRRKVMWWVDAGRCAVVALLCVLVITSQVTAAWIVLTAFILGCGQVFFDVAAQSVIPDVVSRDERTLTIANGRMSAAQTNGEDFVGPPLGSALFSIAQVIPFLGNAVSFAVSSVLVGRLKDGIPPRKPGRPETTLRAEIGEGLRWMIRNRILRVLAITACLGNVVFAAKAAMLVLLAKEVLGLADLGYGLLLTAAAVGAFGGSAIAPFLTGWLGPGRVRCFGAMAEGLAILAMGLTRDPWIAGALMIITGGLMAIQNIVAGTLRQRITPARLFGRVLSSGRLVAYSGAPVGALLGSLIAASYGVQAPYIIGGAFLVVVGLLSLPALGTRAVAELTKSEVADDEPVRE